jgi:hypothetical protein
MLPFIFRYRVGQTEYEGQSFTNCYKFSDILQVATRFSDAFQVFSKCFTNAKQDRLTDVRTDCRVLVRDFGKSSRSQGTTTNLEGDVCGRVK